MVLFDSWSCQFCKIACFIRLTDLLACFCMFGKVVCLVGLAVSSSCIIHGPLIFMELCV